MMFDAGLQGKTAVITGAGNRSGIGCSIASRLAACGRSQGRSCQRAACLSSAWISGEREESSRPHN